MKKRMLLDYIGILSDGKILDCQSSGGIDLVGDKIYPNSSKEALEILRHSTAHLMAQAIKEIYPEAQFFVGPVVNEGFYYDFKINGKISENDFEAIEQKMTEIASKNLDIVKYECTRSEIEEKFINDPLKMMVLKNIKDDTLTLYRQGDFEDLCRGPHLPNTKYIKHFKLTRVAGAYLGGDEENEMITRIYGISFFDRKELKDYLTQLEEAKKRDHRKLGTELELFTFSEDIGAGLPLWLPKGGRLRGKLEKILYKAHRLRDYEPVRGPEILRADMWKLSGHYQNYKENMYFTVIDEQEYGIKPMNCVGHIQIYKNAIRSYRDLPLKFFEYGVVHRHEKSGVMHGLFRVREFTQDDAHIFCTEDQIKEVIKEVLDFVDKLMGKFNFTYEMEVSTKPKKAIGSDEFWESATKGIMNALDEMGLSYGIDEGGGAFYGPKIDIKITDAIGRKWQCGTVQVDMNLPERFEIDYISEENSKKRPVMIHRAILGSFERFIGILIEHYAGELPFSISPTQVILVPIAQDHVEYANSLRKELLELEIDSEIFDKNESLNKRIRTAEKQRVPMIVVIGDNEVENNMIALRDRRVREQSNLTRAEFVELLKKLNSEGEV
jgi:threonyl-tRNA synthetase